jgi:thiosulfate/3-mercaptopyruvate sulfurtransferase
MAYTTLIAPADLRANLDDPAWVIVDCRYDLSDIGAGRRAYQQAHIPGALYAHVDDDLSGAVVPGYTGRHPLPSVEACVRTFSAMGIGSSTQVVAYDDRGGALGAARLWWMLRWLGHDTAAVLDGGWQAWQQAGYPVRSGHESHAPNAFTPRLRPHLLVGSHDVEQQHADPNYRLLDVRKAPRYRGEMEPIDPVAGHIPGAISAPFEENLDESGRFLSPADLHARYETLLGGVPASHTTFYCGSGVSAAHGVLALAHAGLGDARLYEGSWSEWIANSRRPVARGEEP